MMIDDLDADDNREDVTTADNNGEDDTTADDNLEDVTSADYNVTTAVVSDNEDDNSELWRPGYPVPIHVRCWPK